MNNSATTQPLLKGLHRDDFNIAGLDDEIRVDRLCVDLLRRFKLELTDGAELDAEEAGELCRGADYFLRDFIIADRRLNLFELSEAHVRQFGGHWYIIRTAEPNLVELGSVLAGIAAFYRYLCQQGVFDVGVSERIAEACRGHNYFQQRIDDFWAISGDGYDSWRQGCPLEPVKA
jgi:hypothetical protein